MSPVSPLTLRFARNQSPRFAAICWPGEVNRRLLRVLRVLRRRTLSGPVLVAAVVFMACFSTDEGAAENAGRTARSAEEGAKQTAVRSEEARQRTEILFKNTLPEPIRVYWINYQGKEVLYAELKPGESYRQSTYVTHPWRVRSTSDGRVIRTIVADGNIASVTTETSAAPSARRSAVPGTASAMPVIGPVAAAAWLGVVVMLRVKSIHPVPAMYLASLMSFWVLFSYFAYKHGNGGAATEAMFKPVIATVWSPTSDPVLNFLIDAGLVVVGVTFGVGVIVSGLFLMVVLIALLIPALIASASVTGALLVAAGAIAVGVFFFSSRWRWATGRSVEGGDYSSPHGGAEVQRPVARRVWPIGSWSETKETLFGRRYRQHHGRDHTKGGYSEYRQRLLGGGYVQHHDKDDKKAGHTEKRTGFFGFGNSYEQHFDSHERKAGRSEEREGLLGNKYTQHYDSDDKKSGHTEKRSGWFGDYEVHYDKDGKRIEE